MRVCYVSITGAPRVVLQQQYTRVHTNSLPDYPGRTEKELTERRRIGGRRRGIEQLVSPSRRQDGRITRSALKKDAWRIEKKGKREGRERDTRVCVRNNYPASCRPLLPRKSLTSCWRAKVRISLRARTQLWLIKKEGERKKERRGKNFSLPSVAAGL